MKKKNSDIKRAIWGFDAQANNDPEQKKLFKSLLK